VAHEITENVNAHVQVEHDPTVVDKQNLGDEFDADHQLGIAAEDRVLAELQESVLTELQDSGGIPRSGHRINHYPVSSRRRPCRPAASADAVRLKGTCVASNHMGT
jgi:hypothetical protein